MAKLFRGMDGSFKLEMTFSDKKALRNFFFGITPFLSTEDYSDIYFALFGYHPSSIAETRKDTLLNIQRERLEYEQEVMRQLMDEKAVWAEDDLGDIDFADDVGRGGDCVKEPES